MGKNTEKTEIEIVMTGDVLIHEKVIQSGRRGNGTYCFDPFFADILPELASADIRIVNQETIMGGEELGFSGYPSFNSPFETGEAEVRAGFNVVLHATNHALDKGHVGIENCLHYWETKHPDVSVLGINKHPADRDDIFVFDKNGFRISILNYTFESNVMPLPAGKEYCLDLFDKEKIHRDISKAKRLADMVVICPHWGTEYVCTPDTDQREWTRFFLTERADIVIGTHPHVLQPVQMLSDPAGREMLVYYSLGNFVSNQEGIPRNIGGLARIRLVKDAYGSRIESYELIPTVCHRELGAAKIEAYKLSDYSDHLADRNDIKAIDGHTELSVQYVNRFCRDVLGDDFCENERQLRKIICRRR